MVVSEGLNFALSRLILVCAHNCHREGDRAAVSGWSSVVHRGQYSLMLPAGVLLRTEYLQVRAAAFYVLCCLLLLMLMYVIFFVGFCSEYDDPRQE